MTQTLRRELRNKFMDVVREEWVDISAPDGQAALSEALADAALSVAGIAARETHEPDLVDAVVKYHLGPKTVQNAIAEYFRLTPNWEAKYNKQFMEWAVEIKITPEQVKTAAELWRVDKRFNWAAPSLKGIQEHWLELVADNTEKTELL
jgi:hypothetical protein